MESSVMLPVPFRAGSAEWFTIMETMVIIGLLLMIILVGSLYIAITEFRTHPNAPASAWAVSSPSSSAGPGVSRRCLDHQPREKPKSRRSCRRLLGFDSPESGKTIAFHGAV